MKEGHAGEHFHVMKNTKAASETFHLPPFGRDEATRTPDPYVPNVVRYQLRYIPILRCKGTNYL